MQRSGIGVMLVIFIFTVGCKTIPVKREEITLPAKVLVAFQKACDLEYRITIKLNSPVLVEKRGFGDSADINMYLLMLLHLEGYDWGNTEYCYGAVSYTVIVVPNLGTFHCWTQITVDGVEYILDPLARKIFKRSNMDSRKSQYTRFYNPKKEIEIRTKIEAAVSYKRNFENPR